MYEQAGLRIAVKRARVPKPGEPDALTATQQGTVERAAARRGVRDAAIVAVLLYAGARVEECGRLELEDVAITARTGSVRLHGKGDEVRTVPLPAIARARLAAWLDERGREAGPLWTGQRGALTDSGITQVILAVGRDAGIEGLRPHRLRHTFATRLRQGGADPAQVQALLGHASLDTSARYFRAGSAENAAVIERVFNR
jgi:integrase/recombinase XerC